MSSLSVNSFLAYLSSSLQSSGSETTIYLDKISTLTGEIIYTSDFATFGRGTITIDPLSSTDIEFASFTGVSSAAVSLTGAIRGLSAKGNTSSTSRMIYHAVGTPVIISFGVHNLEDLKDYIDGLVAGTIGNASSTVAGVTKLSINPVSPTSPIAVGNNDIRVPQYVVDTGAANAYVITPSPVITAYTAGNTYSFKAANANTGTSTLAVSGLAAKTIKKIGGGTNLAANDIIAGQIVTVMYDGTNFQMLSIIGNVATSPKFGGTGVDGALTITSGTTNIDCLNAAVVVKNYTSISITGTSKITFTNPNANGTIVVFKSQGVVTITTSTVPSIDMRSMGAAGGAAGSYGNYGFGFVFGPQGGRTDVTSTASTGKSLPPSVGVHAVSGTVMGKNISVFAGAGGGGGMTTSGTGGTGGRGAGGLYIECAGALNITSTINASGAVGVADAYYAGSGTATLLSGGGGGAGNTDGNSGATQSTSGSSGGGGGAGSSIVIIYGTLTANSGTYTITGGAAGAGASGPNGGAGGDGYSLVSSNTELF